MQYFLLKIAIQTVLIVSIGNAMKIKCTNSDELFYAIPGSRCKSYYKCTSSGHSLMEECAADAIFDFYKQKCKRSPGTCYEPICTGRSNGVYQDTTHACRRSYTCHNGHVIAIDNCPPDHLHNGHACVQKDLVSCDAPETTAKAYPFPGDVRCARKQDGHYPIDGDCSSYIICADEEVVAIRDCPANFGFHAGKQQCLAKHVLPNCARSDDRSEGTDSQCKNKRDGAHVDPNSHDCSTYIMCRGGKIDSHQRCLHQAVFNGESCVPSPLYECPTQRNSPISDVCQGKSNGLYGNPQHGCASYVRCLYGRTVEVNACPAGYYFDLEANKCINEPLLERRRCFDAGLSLDCDDKPQGFYRDFNCESYYHCHQRRKTEYKCSAGKHYNGEKCVAKSQYKCPKADGDSFCSERPDGFYKDDTDGCRSYHYCTSGHKITYVCDMSHVFDVAAKKCIKQTATGIASSRCGNDFTCRGKSDGYHADLRSNCKDYIYCKNSEKITQLTCRDDNVFNGHKCVSPVRYACPSLYNHRRINCMPKRCMHRCERDGFHPDLNTDCRDYFFCIAGKPSKLSCTAGRRFNGEICVAEDKFNCPIFCENDDLRDGDDNNNCPLGGYVL